MKIQVKDDKRLVRDSGTFAILNTDSGAINTHNLKMNQLAREKTRDDEINKINDDISEIKSMIAQLIKRN